MPYLSASAVMIHEEALYQVHVSLPLQTLLDLGASPNYKDASGLTALYHCVLNAESSPHCVQMLLHERAEIECRDTAGWTELHQVNLHITRTCRFAQAPELKE